MGEGQKDQRLLPPSTNIADSHLLHSSKDHYGSRRRRRKGWGVAARRLRASLKAGLGAATRLEAGNCGEAFACLFQVCAVLPHQACAGGSMFFRRRLPKAGLSGYAHHPWLVPDPERPGSGDRVQKSRFLYVKRALGA